MKVRIAALFLLCCVISSAALAAKPEPPMQWNGRLTCDPQGSPSFCLPIDQTWQVVPFSGDQNCSGPADPTDPCLRNDDDHTVQLPLNFNFDLYGSTYNAVFINNNGNLSFLSGYCTFTSTGFPVADTPMIAPFWADVDTRNAISGAVYYKQGPNYLAVAWDHVGYFDEHADLQNTFQVIISDGTFEPMGLGNNVCFCYGDMNWTTGDASGGVGGYGGSPATVGANKGDGVAYFLIGQFDHPGTDYNGPGGPPSGVMYLSGRNFCFNTGAETNQPPLAINFPPQDSVCVMVGATLQLTVGFIGPEPDQTVHTEVNPFGLANFSFTSTDGNPSEVAMTFVPTADQIGVHTIHFTATDNFNPPGVTERDLHICVEAAIPARETTWGRVKSIFK